jgi:hypothetical protein
MLESFYKIWVVYALNIPFTGLLHGISEITIWVGAKHFLNSRGIHGGQHNFFCLSLSSDSSQLLSSKVCDIMSLNNISGKTETNFKDEFHLYFYVFLSYKGIR